MAKKPVKKKVSSKSKKKSVKKAPALLSFDTLNVRYLMIALLVLTGLATMPVIFNDFISLDDENFILINPVVQDNDFGRAFEKQFGTPHYKPLVYSSWVVEHMLFGNHPLSYHLINWLLHLVNTALAFYCFRRIARIWNVTRPHATSIAFFTALLFGVHPLHIESVAWAIERKDVLFSAFYLGGLLSYLRFLDTRQQKYILMTGLFYILSLLSKSMGISLVGILFIMDITSGRRDWLKMFLEKWPVYIGFIMALVVYGVISLPEDMEDQGSVRNTLSDIGDGAAKAPPTLANTPSFYQELMVANFRYLFFTLHTIFPVRLAIVYSREFLIALPGALIHALPLLTLGLWSLPVLVKKYRWPILAGLLIFTAGISPILIEEGMGSNFASDRYTYVPSLGILMLMSILMIKALPRQVFKGFRLGEAVLLGIAVLFSIGAARQAVMWGDDVKLFTQAIDNYPGNWVAYHYRGGAYDLDDPDKALADYTESLKHNPNRGKTHYSRGTLLLNLRRFNEAIPDFTKTIEHDPRHHRAFTNRANCYRDIGQLDLAMADYNYVLNRDPYFTKALNNRGVVFLKRKQYDKALKDFDTVISVDPVYVNAYINKAAVYIDSGVRDYEQGIVNYDAVLAIEPDNVQATFFKAYSLQRLQRYDEALDWVNRAIALRPDSGGYYYTRAQILKSMGRRQESIQDAKRAQQMGVDVAPRYLQ